MFFIKLFLQTHDKVVILYWIRYRQQLIRNDSFLEKVGNFGPIVNWCLSQTRFLRLLLRVVCFRDIRAYSIVSG